MFVKDELGTEVPYLSRAEQVLDPQMAKLLDKSIWGFPRIGVPVWGVPMIRIRICRVYIRGTPYFGRWFRVSGLGFRVRD